MRSIFIKVLIILSVLINIFSFNKAQDWGDDFAGYVLQAKTIHSGSYSDLKTNIKKTDFILNYPWGFPFLISPLIKYFDTNVVIIKIYIFLFFLAGLIVVFYLFRKDKEIALLTVLFISSSPYFWEFKNYILSDIPNLFFVLLTVFVADRFIIKRKTIINEYFTAFITGVLIYVSYMLRNQSIVLLPAIILVQIILFWRRIFSLKKMLMIFIPIVVFPFLVYLSSVLIPVKSTTYLDQYNNLQLRKTVWENIFYYINIWKELFATTDEINNVTAVFTGFFITFVSIGFFSGAKQNILVAVFFSLNILLVLISPFHQGIRYLMPLIPFFFYFFIIGLRRLVYYNNEGNKFKHLAYYSVVGIIIMLSIKTILTYSYQSLISQQEWEGPYKKTSIEMFSYIRDNSFKNETIGFCKPRAMLLYTDRNSIVPVSYEQCFKRKIGYLVYYKNTNLEQLSLESIRGHADDFCEVFQNVDFIIFKMRRSGS